MITISGVRETGNPASCYRELRPVSRVARFLEISLQIETQSLLLRFVIGMKFLLQIKPYSKCFLISVIAGVSLLLIIIYKSMAPKTALEDPCEVYVYTYSSFASPTGVGGDLKKLFKEETDCDVHFENIGDARMLVQKLRSELKIKNSVDADVVLGLDQFSIQEAYGLLQWQDISLEEDIKLSKRLSGTHLSQEDINPFNVFVPYNWSPFTFIYRPDGETQRKVVFETPKDILKSNMKYSLMDPRSSSPGFQFLVWMIHQFGEETLYQFIKKAYFISPSWSTAYGLFTKKQTHAAFSYLTSLAYHWIEENNTDFQIMNFDLGHPYQIEFAGIVAGSSRIKTAVQFVKFLHLREVQKLIMTKNYMFPIVQSVEEETAFAKLPHLSLVKDHKLQRPERVYLQYWKQFQKGAVFYNADIY